MGFNSNFVIQNDLVLNGPQRGLRNYEHGTTRRYSGIILLVRVLMLLLSTQPWNSIIHCTMAAGVTYVIQATGYGEEEGYFVLSLSVPGTKTLRVY